MNGNRLAWVALVAVLFAAGCEVKDQEAPPKPRLATLRTPTSLDKVVFKGTAEYGAKIAVTRNPSWTGPELTADPFTAEFELEAPLEMGENTFSFTATDAAGNASEAATVKLERVAFTPKAVRLSVPLDPLSADRPVAAVAAQILTDEAVSLAGLDVAFSALHEDGTTKSEATAKTDNLGFAKASLAGLSKAGLWTLTATLAGVSDSALVLVLGGVPASAELSLQSLDATGMPTSGAAITLPPDSLITAKLVVTDGSPSANLLSTRWSLRTDAPGAFVAGDTISGVVLAGKDYQVVAVIEGATTLTAAASFTVIAGRAENLALKLSKSAAVAGEAVEVQALATDAWGNSAAGTLSAIAVAPALAATFNPPDGSAALPQGLSGTGFVAYDLAGVAGSGYTFEFLVSAPGTDPLLTASAKLKVEPGPAAGFKLVDDPANPGGAKIPDFLFLTGCTAPATRCASATVAAGTKVAYEYKVADPWGNERPGAVTVATDIPGALVFDDGVAGGLIENLHLASAAAYEVAGRVAGVQGIVKRALTVVPGPTTNLSLGLSKAKVAAGEQVLLMPVATDAYGNASTASLSPITVNPAPATSFTPPGSSVALNQGLVGSTFIVYDLSSVKASGYTFQFSLSAPGTSPLLTATAVLEVAPAAAAGLKLVDDPANPGAKIPDFLFLTGCTAPATKCTTASVAAGTEVAYEYQAVDKYGNDRAGPVTVVTNAPAAQIADDGTSGSGVISNLVMARATSYDVTAYVAGVSGGLKRSLFVGTGAPATVSLALTGTLVPLASQVKAMAMVRDAFGNPVACPASNPVDVSVMEITSSPAASATSTLTCLGGVFTQTFTFATEGTYTLTATYKTGPVSTSAYVNVMGFDTTAPTIQVANVRVNGVACVPAGTVPSCPCSPGDTIDFDLVASDNASISEVMYTAYFATSGTGTLRTRTVLVAANTPLPVTVPFRFNVPGNTQIEEVPLVGLAIDGAGNRASSAQLILSVNLFASGGRTVTVVASGGLVSGPMDMVFDPWGNLLIANDGAANLLTIPSGTTAPQVWSGFNLGSDFITADLNGNLFVSSGPDLWRVDSFGGAATYLTLAGGNMGGLTMEGPGAAKGVINATTAIDTATVRVGATTYEIDLIGNGCTAGRTCVVTGGNPAGQALATAIQAAGEVNASYNATASRVVLSAKATGTAGNSVVLTGSAAITVSPNTGTLRDGHDQELYLGQSGDNNVYRLPLGLAGAALPGSASATFGVGRTQLGVAVKNMSTATSSDWRDLYVYVVDAGVQSNLRSFHFVDGNAGVQTFSVNGGGGTWFQNLYDIELEPTRPAPGANPVNGCLLATDRNAGAIYAIDVRNPANPTPQVTVIATGLNDPRGLTFHNGDLYVADRGFNSIIRISPSASTTDCF
ncbi:MAG TPA: hypothetical protein VGK67_19060 [Myxococcales bacterium]|jgi:hypothetical protein